MTVKELKKLSRRLAMTGGYEVELASGLNVEDLQQLVEIHLPELESYEKGTTKYRSNNSYRVLNLVSSHPSVSIELSEIIQKILK
jgi:hypothetical protein